MKPIHFHCSNCGNPRYEDPGYVEKISECLWCAGKAKHNKSSPLPENIKTKTIKVCPAGKCVQIIACKETRCFFVNDDDEHPPICVLAGLGSKPTTHYLEFHSKQLVGEKVDVYTFDNCPLKEFDQIIIKGASDEESND